MKTLSIVEKEPYTIIQLLRGKVNAINLEMVKEIRETIASLEVNNKVKGAIITGVPDYFSAGLDVIELYSYNEREIKSFFTDFAAMFHDLYRFPKPLICAVTGYSPAGGTVIAITADYRVMADKEKYVIGLNEMAVNVQISQNLVDAYTFNIGSSLANQFILDGKLLSPREALSCGLVQEICPLEETLERAEIKMQQYLKSDIDIFRNTKYKLRKSIIKKLEDGGEIELEQTMNIWWKPEVRQKMKSLIENITNKK